MAAIKELYVKLKLDNKTFYRDVDKLSGVLKNLADDSGTGKYSNRLGVLVDQFDDLETKVEGANAYLNYFWMNLRKGANIQDKTVTYGIELIEKLLDSYKALSNYGFETNTDAIKSEMAAWAQLKEQLGAYRVIDRKTTGIDDWIVANKDMQEKTKATIGTVREFRDATLLALAKENFSGLSFDGMDAGKLVEELLIFEQIKEAYYNARDALNTYVEKYKEFTSIAANNTAATFDVEKQRKASVELMQLATDADIALSKLAEHSEDPNMLGKIMAAVIKADDRVRAFHNDISSFDDNGYRAFLTGLAADYSELAKVIKPDFNKLFTDDLAKGTREATIDASNLVALRDVKIPTEKITLEPKEVVIQPESTTVEDIGIDYDKYILYADKYKERLGDLKDALMATKEATGESFDISSSDNFNDSLKEVSGTLDVVDKRVRKTNEFMKKFANAASGADATAAFADTFTGNKSKNIKGLAAEFDNLRDSIGNVILEAARGNIAINEVPDMLGKLADDMIAKVEFMSSTLEKEISEGTTLEINVDDKPALAGANKVKKIVKRTQKDIADNDFSVVSFSIDDEANEFKQTIRNTLQDSSKDFKSFSDQVNGIISSVDFTKMSQEAITAMNSINAYIHGYTNDLVDLDFGPSLIADFSDVEGKVDKLLNNAGEDSNQVASSYHAAITAIADYREKVVAVKDDVDDLVNRAEELGFKKEQLAPLQVSLDEALQKVNKLALGIMKIDISDMSLVVQKPDYLSEALNAAAGDSAKAANLEAIVDKLQASANMAKGMGDTELTDAINVRLAAQSKNLEEVRSKQEAYKNELQATMAAEKAKSVLESAHYNSLGQHIDTAREKLTSLDNIVAKARTATSFLDAKNSLQTISEATGEAYDEARALEIVYQAVNERMGDTPVARLDDTLSNLKQITGQLRIVKQGVDAVMRSENPAMMQDYVKYVQFLHNVLGRSKEAAQKLSSVSGAHDTIDVTLNTYLGKGNEAFRKLIDTPTTTLDVEIETDEMSANELQDNIDAMFALADKFSKTKTPAFVDKMGSVFNSAKEDSAEIANNFARIDTSEILKGKGIEVPTAEELAGLYDITKNFSKIITPSISVPKIGGLLPEYGSETGLASLNKDLDTVNAKAISLGKTIQQAIINRGIPEASVFSSMRNDVIDLSIDINALQQNIESLRMSTANPNTAYFDALEQGAINVQNRIIRVAAAFTSLDRTDKSKLSSQLSNLSTKLGGVLRDTNQLGNSLNNVKRQANDASRYIQLGFSKAQAEILATTSAADMLNTVLSTIKNSAVFALITRGVGMLVDKLGIAGSMAQEFNQTIEYSKATFTSLTGDAATSTELLQVLAEYAASTPISFEQATTAAKSFMAYGVQAENALYMVKGLTAAMSVQGMDEQKMESMTRAFGQIFAKGTIRTEEVNQLAEAGIEAREILKEKLDLSDEDLLNLGKANIDSKRALNALIEGIEERYGAMINVAMTTTDGLISNIKDNLSYIGGAFIKPISEQIRTGLKIVSDFMTTLRNAIDTDGIGGLFEALVPDPALQESLRLLTSNLKQMLKAIVNIMSSGIGGFIDILATAFNTIAPVIHTVLTVIQLFQKVLASLGPIATIITKAVGVMVGIFALYAAKVGLATLATKLFGKAGEETILGKAVLALKALGAQVVATVQVWVKGFLAMTTAQQALTLAIAGTMAYLLMFTDAGKSLRDSITGFFKDVVDSINGIFNVDGSKEFEKTTESIEADADKYSKPFDEGANALDNMADSAEDAADAAKGLLSFDEVFKLNEDAADAGIDSSYMDEYADGYGDMGDYEIEPFADWFMNGWDDSAFTDMTSELSNIALKLGAVTGAAGLLKLALTKIPWGTVASAAGTVAGNIGKVLAGLDTSPVLLFAGALGTLATGIYTVYEGLTTGNWSGLIPTILGGLGVALRSGWLSLAGLGAGWFYKFTWDELAKKFNLSGWTAIVDAIMSGLSGVLQGVLAGSLKAGVWGAIANLLGAGLSNQLINWLATAFELTDQDVKNGKIGQQIGNVIGSIVGFFIGGPLGAALGGVIGQLLGAGIGAMWEKSILPELEQFGVNVVYWCDILGENVGGIWQGIVDGWNEFWGNVGYWLGELGKWWEGVCEFFDGCVTAIFAIGGDIIQGLIDGMVGPLKTAWDAVSGFFGDLLQAIKDFFGIHSPSTVMAEIGGFLIDGLIDGILDAWNGFVEFWSGLGEKILGLFSGLKEKAGEFATGAIEKVKEFGKGAKEKIVDFIDNTKTNIGNWVSSTATSIGNWKNNLVTKVTEGMANAKTKVSTFVSTTKTTLSTWASSVANTISSLLNKAKNLASSAANTVTSAVSGAATWTATTATTTASAVQSEGTKFLDNVVDLITGKDFKKATLVGHATGGVFNREHYALLNEGNKSEAVIPLENNSAMQPFVDAVAQGLSSYLGPVLSSMQSSTTGNTYNNELQPIYVGNLIADDRSLRELERRMNVIRLQENRRS